jgi:hypothetical protein
MTAGKFVVTLVAHLALFSGVQSQVAGAPDRGPRIYSTSFGADEVPISEGGLWINGRAVGLDWKDVSTKSGLAFGADSSGNPHYDDPTAILSGVWGPDQTVQAKVHTVNQNRKNVDEEVEIRLRSRISPHWNSGYEINFRCRHDGSQYVEIVRWNGRLGDFTYLRQVDGPGLYDGDVVRASIIGGVITAFINGTQVAQTRDTTFTQGNPGMGFYLAGKAGLNTDYGFTFFSASDGALPWSPSDLRIASALGLIAPAEN